MTVIDFLYNVLGDPGIGEISNIYYIVAALILFIFIDGIIGFLLSGISSLTMRGHK